MRAWEIISWDVSSGWSSQPINGGPWYIFRNQITGHKGQTFKLRSGSGLKIIVGNTMVSGTVPVQNGHQLFERGCVFANNFWAMYRAPFQNILADVAIPPDPNLMRLFDYNRYDADSEKIYNGVGVKTLDELNSLGFELHTELVNVSNCVSGQVLFSEAQEELGFLGKLISLFKMVFGADFFSD
jgi:hypothetical protein